MVIRTTVKASCCRPGKGWLEDVEMFRRQQAGRSVFGLYTQRRQESHGSGGDLVVTGSVDYLITTPEEKRQIGSQNGHQGEVRLAFVASGLKVKSGCCVDEMQNESGRNSDNFHAPVDRGLPT